MEVMGCQKPNKDATRLPKFKTTDGKDAAYLADSYGLSPYPWQELVLDHALGRDKDDELTASQVCISVARQNGKNALIEMIELFQLVVLGRRILHTAHQIKTAREAFMRIRRFFTNPDYPELRALVANVRQSNGQEAIELVNGATIYFSARSQGASRGFTVDTLVLDEAQELDDETLAAQLPIISAAPSRQPQQIITGTPPTTKSSSEVWSRLRATAQERSNPKLMWAEWSPPDTEGVDITSESVWALANPSLGYIIKADSIAGELAAMEPGTFMRERLGMWSTMSSQQQALPIEDWDMCSDKEFRASASDFDQIVLAADLTPSRDSGALVVAATFRDGGLPLIDVVDQRAGSPDWIPAKAKEIVDRLGVTAVIIDAYSPAASLITALESRGIGVTKVGIAEVASSAERLLDATVTHRLRHLDQAALKVAIAGARRRKVGDGRFAFGRLSSATDISPLVAASLAFGALASHPEDFERINYRAKKRPGAPKKNYTRKVIVM